jgi:hypothetical protein
VTGVPSPAAAEPSGAGQPKHQLVVVGAGFAGVELVKRLKGVRGLDIHLLDGRNHHIFQPLLYQAATSILAPSQVAWPVRQLMRGRADVTTLMAEVTAIDTAERRVAVAGGAALAYDTLVLPPGPPTPTSAMTPGRPSRRASRPWRTPPRSAGASSWPSNAPRPARLTRAPS